jgi:hypothetical protein
MKKQILLAATVLFSAGILFFTGCKKDDTTGPVITVTGGATETSVLNAAWTDQGATAEDDQDGAVTVTTSGTVNIDLAGPYTITYTATDAAGNESTETRTVTVYNQAEAFFAATYTSASEVDVLGLYTYNPTGLKPFIVTASTTINNQLIMNRLGDYDNNAVYMNVVGTAITIPSQTHTNVGLAGAPCDVHDRHTDGTGTKTANGFTLNYNDNKIAPCTGTRSGVIATFVK